VRPSRNDKKVEYEALQAVKRSSVALVPEVTLRSARFLTPILVIEKFDCAISNFILPVHVNGGT
jgi:hypothetical protein